jgi:hypothetical protein|tara:strand:- start:1390 stop:1917 length:528 start_codon:yes stop_codon:yes gene_type:complete
MNKQNIQFSFDYYKIKSSLSLYLFTLGSLLLGFAVYLLMESSGLVDKNLSTWSGQGIFWALILFFMSLFILFLPIEFFNTFNLKNNNFQDLIANVSFIIFTSLFFLVFFQLFLPNDSVILYQVTAITRAVSFSGFIVIPLLLFVLNNLGKRFNFIENQSYSVVILVWLLSSQIFL